MRLRLFAAFAAAITVSGCSCVIDPESVEFCTPVGCAAKACGDSDCGTLCAVGSGCQETHTVRGALVGGAGAVSSTSHSAQGELTAGGGDTAAASGHSVVQGTLSR